MTGDAVRRFLVHEQGYPEYIAVAHLLAAVANAGAEIIWHNTVGSFPRLNRFSVDEFDYSQINFGDIFEISDRSGMGWDSALPFIRTVMPDAVPESHTPVAVQASEFETELRRLAARAVMADALVARLSQSLRHPSQVIGLEQLGLLDILNSSGWRAFFELASDRFARASELNELIDLYRRFRTLSVNTSEIEHAWRYLGLAGRADDPAYMQLTVRTLTTRFELSGLIALPSMWPVVFDEFRRWESDRAESYRRAHEATRADASSAAQLIERGSRLAVAIDRLRTLQKLPSQGVTTALDGWASASFEGTTCSLGASDVDLRSEPYCLECETGFSVPNRTEQITTSLSALEAILSRINAQVSAAAVNEILKGEQSSEVLMLLRLSEASNINIDRAAAESGTAAFVARYLSDRSEAS